MSVVILMQVGEVLLREGVNAQLLQLSALSQHALNVVDSFTPVTL